MRTFFAIAAAVLIATPLMGTSAYASSDGIRHRTVTRTAVSGQKYRLGSNNLVTANCGSDQVPKVIIREAPKHGSVNTQIEPDFAKGTGPYAKCSKTKIRSAVVYYTSKPGYVGKDRIVIRVLFLNGQVDDNIVNMVVIKK